MLLIIPVIGIVLLKNLLISLRTRFRSSGHVAVLRSESTGPKDRRSLRVRQEICKFLRITILKRSNINFKRRVIQLTKKIQNYTPIYYMPNILNCKGK